VTPLPPDLARLLPDARPAVARAWTHAPYLRGLIRRFSMDADPDSVVAAALDLARDDTKPVAERLREAKHRIHLATALADLSGAWSLERVTAALSDFADASIDAAIRAALAERDAPNAGFVALALGKLGSRELNYSSDVDLILLYDPAVIPCRPREDSAEAAVRIAKRVVQILDAPTGDGYVWRVDLRLRPASEITPLALPIAAAEHYYQSDAETWERTAFIRARACGGDIALGEGFLRAIAPFVWRRSLDYTAVRDIQSVSLRIRDHFEAGQALGPGFDLKRGRGGIREVEFFAQIHQLIWGGRDTALRTPATLDALAALGAAGRIDAADAAALADAYRLLRTVEHRLQMRADEQTHAIPRLAAHREALAALCDAADWRHLEGQIGAATRTVAALYDRLIDAAAGDRDTARVPTNDKALKAWLKARAPAAATAILPLLPRWRDGRARALRSPPAREAFEALLPVLIPALAATADPARTAARLDVFLAQLTTGVQFFALLGANPPLTGLLARLLGLSPWVADTLARTPALFDVLLGEGAFAPLADAAALAAELRNFARADDIETVLDRVRRWTGERRFQLAAQLVDGAADPLRVARDLASLADAAVGVILDAVTTDMARALGRVPGGRLIVVGLGRYGGGMLSHASDLDLVYLFTSSLSAVSDGARALPATEYFNRLAARLTAALSVATAAGALYEVDTRLRPWGAKGLLAVSVESFTAYQTSEAETWEHMALTRARVVSGGPRDARRLAALAATIIDGRAAARDGAKLRAEVLAMRADITAAKPGKGLWDVKLAPGGLVDLEFIVHFLQLRDRLGLTPDLGEAVRLLVPDLADAHDLLTRVLVTLRLLAPDGVPAPAARDAIARTAGVDDVEAAIGLAKAAVTAAWSTTFGQKRSGA